MTHPLCMVHDQFLSYKVWRSPYVQVLLVSHLENKFGLVGLSNRPRKFLGFVVYRGEDRGGGCHPVCIE